MTKEERFEEAQKLYDAKQYDRAIPLLATLAKNDHAPALKLLGESFLSGIGVQQDTQTAYTLLQASVDAEAKEPNKQDTVERLTKAADAGDVNAQYSLGEHYDSVFVWSKAGGNAAEYWAKAAEWYRKAAEQGHARAQWRLGCAYDQGHGIQKDRVKAAEWWLKAAENGNADSQYIIAGCYQKAKGVKQDFNAAVKWYRKALEQGREDARIYIEDYNDKEAAQRLAEYEQSSKGKVLSTDEIDALLDAMDVPETQDSPPPQPSAEQRAAMTKRFEEADKLFDQKQFDKAIPMSTSAVRNIQPADAVTP